MLATGRRVSRLREVWVSSNKGDFWAELNPTDGFMWKELCGNMLLPSIAWSPDFVRTGWQWNEIYHPFAVCCCFFGRWLEARMKSCPPVVTSPINYISYGQQCRKRISLKCYVMFNFVITNLCVVNRCARLVQVLVAPMQFLPDKACESMNPLAKMVSSFHPTVRRHQP
jgi:hypothetical protein